MLHLANQINVYLEIGQKRTFAGALDWPGWCRAGRDEAAALQALCDYGPRYARVLHGATIDFQSPTEISEFNVVERLVGNATTDFGAPLARQATACRLLTPTCSASKRSCRPAGRRSMGLCSQPRARNCARGPAAAVVTLRRLSGMCWARM